MAEFMNQENASDALAITIDQLKKWKEEAWFPKDGYVNGRGYDVEKIKEARVLRPESSEPAYLINRIRFSPTCPRSEHHKSRVYRTVGRVRHCVCDDCGHEWQQPGEYANVQAETLNRIVKALDEAERTDLPDGKGGTVQVILIEAGAARQMASYCRGAIRAKS
jgi:hypothetical protein